MTDETKARPQTSFGGEPIWPKCSQPYRVEFSMSCGWVIVDPDGRESTLGYAKREHADDVAAKMTEAYWNGAYRHGASRRPFGDGDRTDPEWGDNQTRNPPEPTTGPTCDDCGCPSPDPDTLHAASGIRICNACENKAAAKAREHEPLSEDRCLQCGKRCPNATCPACQEKNVREQNDAKTRSL